MIKGFTITSINNYRQFQFYYWLKSLGTTTIIQPIEIQQINVSFRADE